MTRGAVPRSMLLPVSAWLLTKAQLAACKDREGWWQAGRALSGCDLFRPAMICITCVTSVTGSGRGKHTVHSCVVPGPKQDAWLGS